MIYFDNAATSWPKPSSVVEAVGGAFNYAANPGRGSHKFAMKSAREVFGVREKIKNFIGAESTRNIVFTKNCTEGLNIAIFGSLQAGDHVITTVFEHNSVLRPLFAMKERGVDLDVIDCDFKDIPQEILKRICPETRMVAISHVDNLVGRIKDIRTIGNSLSREILFLVDAAQSIGHIPIDVDEMRIDLLAAPGHKALMGPMGTGFLYVRDEMTVLPFMVGGTGSRITFAFGIIPIGFIAVKGKLNLSLLQLCFLQRENIRIRFFKLFSKAFFDDRSEAINVP